MATTIPTAPRDLHGRNLLALLAAGFVLTGIPTVIIGPILPVFISRWSLSDTQAGLFFSVQFMAALCGVWLTTALTSRYGYRPSLVIGYVLTGVGLAALNAPTHVLALVATAAFGVGYGMVVPPTNLSAAEAGGASMVSLLNFAWGIGAVACSPLILVALRHHFLTSFLWIVGLCALLLAVGFLMVSFPADAHAISPESAGTERVIPTLAITVVMSALFFTYVGTETSIGGWAAEHTKRLVGHATSLTTMAPLFFYAGLMLGRGAAPLILKCMGEFRVVLTALAMDVVGIVLIIGARSPRMAVVGLAIAGLACSSIYPIYISWFSKWYGAAARRLGGVVFSTASLGAAALPWLVGWISTGTGSLRIGLLVPLGACFVMLGLLTILRRRGLAFSD